MHLGVAFSLLVVLVLQRGTRGTTCSPAYTSPPTSSPVAKLDFPSVQAEEMGKMVVEHSHELGLSTHV